ncbi:MAG: FemAB, partial [Sphingopyxis sp.]
MPFDGCAVAPGGGAPTTPAAIGPVHVSTSIADGDLVAFLAAHPQSTPFHSAAWGRAVEGATGHRWHILVARGGDGAILGVLPLHHIRSRLFGSTLASAGFAVDGGLLVTHPSAIDPLADAAIALARELGVPGVDLRGGIAPAGWTVD